MRPNLAFTFRFFLSFVFLFTLIGIATAEETKNAIPLSLKELVNGSSTDYQAVLSSMEDEDLPAALAITDILRFQAVHGESGLKPADISAFKNAVENRLAGSTIVSFQKTEECTVAVPQKEVSIGEQRIIIPPLDYPLAFSDY